ncbi:sterile alpha motif domain-containing protein 1-like [Conger conger]|uniref:sterile alpha motif domain-containing protein 1-like n=1 Tax=Conger conger TaxID=82655 RepID=UPI002A5B0068|nr:sterile alpha motif domain-containing protein 1-like [Conger conger]
MSDAILTFQVQLSAVMETVLKSAMYEITRLVEDSFLEEVARSKQEVEALRQRLQWWESRRRERESGGRARCVDCGRAGVSSQETEDPPSGTPSGAEGAPPLPLSKGCGEPEWSPAVRQDTAPSSDSLLAEQSSRAAAGESCGSYESQGQEGSARSLSLAGPQRCGRHWQRPAWTPFKLGDSDSEPDGLDPSYAAEPEPASPPAQREPQPRPAEEGAGHSASPLQYLNVKWEGGVADAPLVKEEAEMQPVCSEEMRWDAAHREPWDRGDLQVACLQSGGARKTHAQRQREYRARVKLDPSRYQEQRASETLRVRMFRQRRSEEAVRRDREMARLRMREYRSRKRQTEGPDERAGPEGGVAMALLS